MLLRSNRDRAAAVKMPNRHALVTSVLSCNGSMARGIDSKFRFASFAFGVIMSDSRFPDLADACADR